jgi:hypothetical protein
MPPFDSRVAEVSPVWLPVERVAEMTGIPKNTLLQYQSQDRLNRKFAKKIGRRFFYHHIGVLCRGVVFSDEFYDPLCPGKLDKMEYV